MQKISKQTDLVSKKDFDNILISFKTEYLQVQQKLNSPTSYRYFLSRMYFTSPIESQNVWLSTNTWHIRVKKDEDTDFIPTLKSKEAYTSKHKPLYSSCLHIIKLSGYRMGIKLDIT